MEEKAEEFPDKRYEVVRALEDGDLVAVHAKVKGVFDTDFSVIHIFRFRDDKMIEEWDASQQELEDSPNANGLF